MTQLRCLFNLQFNIGKKRIKNIHGANQMQRNTMH